MYDKPGNLSGKRMFTLSIYMPYTWTQELYISFKLTRNCNAFKT